MIIYHGSKTVVKEPQCKGSNPNNDYGPAFYMTLDLESAKSWACKNDIIGLVNKYRIDNNTFQKLKILDLTDRTKYNALNWIAILMHFRELPPYFKQDNQQALAWLSRYYIDVEQYDVVIGYRADDSYFKFPLGFIDGKLAYDDLETVYLKGNLGVQYAFISERAIKLLRFIKVINCESTFLGLHYAIVSKASAEVNAILDLPSDYKKTYLLDLMRKDNG